MTLVNSEEVFQDEILWMLFEKGQLEDNLKEAWQQTFEGSLKIQLSEEFTNITDRQTHSAV